MRLDRATELVKTCAERMNARFEGVVFDEWAILSLADGRGRLLSYLGPRKQGFQKSFLSDFGALRERLVHVNYAVGDFSFPRESAGPGFQAFMVVGRGFYLVCNNTVQTMDALTSSPRWLGTQMPFVELSEKFRANPLELARSAVAARAKVQLGAALALAPSSAT
jgi:hypothetical protein